MGYAWVISCIMWKDKCPILLLSTHATPICASREIWDMVPRKHGVVLEQIFTSLVLVEYTQHMRGVDVADQLQASYSCQTRSHKWWQRVFWFLIDTSIVNMYVMYLQVWSSMANPGKPKMHLQFKMDLCTELLRNWATREDLHNHDLEHCPDIHMPSWSSIHCNCVVCHAPQIHTYCFQYVGRFMCLRWGCYKEYHITHA